MEENPGWFVHKDFSSWAELFEDKYHMVDFVFLGDPLYARSKTRKQDGRHCIFCNKSYPEVSFSNAAHLISKMIGNTDLYSTFECDSCNNKFSLFETDLAYFLGVGRSLVGMQENKKPPGFPGINLETRSIIYKNKNILIIKTDNANRIDNEELTQFEYQKPTYTPSNVYKLFLKCALSVLPKEVVISEYQSALSFLRGEKVLSGAHINVIRFPLSVKMPLHVYIFRKKEQSDGLPTYMASFYFHNLVISFPILLHRDDFKFINQTILLPKAPPYFLYDTDLNEISPSCYSYDLSSPLKTKNQTEELSFQFDKSQLEKAVMFDPLTGVESIETYNPSDSKYLIATQDQVTFTKEELSELIKLIEAEFGKNK